MVKDAVPPLSDVEPSVAAPSRRETVPVLALVVTETVNFTGCPAWQGFTDEVSRTGDGAARAHAVACASSKPTRTGFICRSHVQIRLRALAWEPARCANARLVRSPPHRTAAGPGVR
jgi:hypothetical protein